MDSQNLQNNENYFKDNNFFKKVWYSMTKFEKYPEMAAHGVPRAFLYLAELMIVFSIILTVIIFFYINKTSQKSEGVDDSDYYKRFETTLNVKLDDIQRQEIDEIFSEYNSRTINIMFLIASVISIFIGYFIITLIDILTLSLFGMITCYMAKIKIKYKAIFNMSTYAITISVILRLIYEGLLLLADFRIKYFNVMYTSIAYICLAASIFMIRSDLIKQQIELMKVIEEKKKKAYEEEQKPKKDEEENKEENNEQNNENEKDKNEDVGRGEEQGSNA